MSGNMQMPMPQGFPQGFPRPNGQAARWETRPQNAMPSPAMPAPYQQMQQGMQMPGILDRIAAQTPQMFGKPAQLQSLLDPGYVDAGGP